MVGRNRVIFAGMFRLPQGDATTARVLGLAKALRLAGYEVLLAPEQSPGDVAKEFTVDGFECHAIPEGAGMGRFAAYLSYGKAMAKWLAGQDLSRCSALVAVGGYATYFFWLRRLLRRRGVAYVVDCTDWMGAGQIFGVARHLQPLNVDLSMRLLHPRAENVIAISRFFERFYSAAGCNVVRVPPLVDLDDAKWARGPDGERPANELRLVYAGNPGHKDLLKPVLSGMLRSENRSVSLSILGPSAASLRMILGKDSALLDALGDRVKLHGRIPLNSVPAFLMQHDFSVLLRPNMRYANAGFPTKLVESLAAGVPAIVNHTGDIGCYVRDGQEGFLVEQPTARHFAAALDSASAMSANERAAMRSAARRRAAESFSYQAYAESLGDFMRRVVA